MAKIIRSADCGNSPKNKFVQEIAIWALTGEVDELSLHLSGEVEIEGVTAGKAIGKSAVLRSVEKIGGRPTRIEISHAFAHGRVGAASGRVKDGRGRVREFCLVIEFASAAAKTVRSLSYYEMK